ncbi:MAG: nitrogen regulation protein, partial [Pseudomonadota bacterium]
MNESRTILIADDDRAIRTVLSQALGRAGYQVRATSSAATLWRWVEDGEGDLVITDVIMPDENGLDLVPRIRRIRPEMRVIVMSAQSTFATAIKATQRGAFEYLPKPFDLKEVLSTVERALAAPPDAPPPEEAEGEKLPLIGRSAAMQEIYRTVARLTTTDLTVMVTGESGTGKELIARALHDYGKRRAGPFVAINMAAIPRELIEAELFGHERGAFTGALNRGIGRFEQAAGGTLFLDEIGDMPPELQTRLLRVLSDGTFYRVGGHQPIRANVRVIAATHQDLESRVREGQFREDLYHRLNVIRLRLPSLRERREDIPLLARHFLARSSKELGVEAKRLSDAAMTYLNAQDFPGNVRQLENVCHWLTVMAPTQVIEVSDLPPELREGPIAGGDSDWKAALGREADRMLARGESSIMDS